MALRIKSRKILIPDVPPPAMRKHQDLVIAGIEFSVLPWLLQLLYSFFSVPDQPSVLAGEKTDRVYCEMNRIFRIFSLAILILLIA
jgi:hypothetical protein